MSRVSVVLAVFNGLPHVREAVESVLSQTHVNWQLIIVNDGSTDGTKEYLNTLSDRRIEAVHQANAGVSAARNKGLELVRGDYVCFLDADDAYPPDSLRLRVEYLNANPQVNVVDGVIHVFDEKMSHLKKIYQPYYEGMLLPRLLRLDARVFFGHTYFFRRVDLASLRFVEGMTHAEDLMFYVSLAHERTARYGFVDAVIYHCRSTPHSAMSNLAGIERGYVQFFNRVKKLQGMDFIDVLVLRLKLMKIVFLSHVAAKAWGKAWRGALKFI
jgi:teichuronic acid biosynthesis glycosyltransferase TuaG